MRISDWSSDVCSSDLTESARDRRGAQGQRESGLPDPRPGAAAPARTAQVLAGSGRYIACLTCQFPLPRRIALGERVRVRGALAKPLIGQIGRALFWDRVLQTVWIAVVVVSLLNKT